VWLLKTPNNDKGTLNGRPRRQSQVIVIDKDKGRSGKSRRESIVPNYKLKETPDHLGKKSKLVNTKQEYLRRCIMKGIN
jgi:hypothetical protein